MELTALWVSLKLAFITTIILLIISTPIAWWLAKTKHPSKILIESIIALPLILPPTVIGFYILIILGAKGPLGNFNIAFNFNGLIFGSVIYSLPFVVQPLQGVFKNIDQRLIEAASTLRANSLDRFISVILPNTKHGFLTATILGFTHTLGEFGIVLMIGGSIPGKTKTLSIAIYDHVEQLEYTQAHILAAGLLITSFITLLILYWVNHKSQQLRVAA